MNVFPNPYIYEKKDGNLVFSENVNLMVSDSFKNEKFLKLSCELWDNFTSGKSNLNVIKSSNLKNAAIISASKVSDAFCGKTDYEYEIDCGCEKILITYSEDVGLIHAFSTILQLVGPYRRKTGDFSIDCFVIKDKPALKFRAVHFCIFPETSFLFLKKMIRLCGLMKCSHLILEPWGMIKLESFPYLAWKNAFSKEQIKELADDGKALGISFIPMMNQLGHASMSRFKCGKHVVLDQAPEYEELFLPAGWTWNIKNNETLKVLEDVRKELCEIFDGCEYFHIGCDESLLDDNRKKDPDVHDVNAHAKYINSVSESLKKLGKKTIAWGDMFLDKDPFAYPFCANITDRKNSIDILDKDVIVADWQYNIDVTKDESVRYFLKTRDAKTLILCPWTGNDNIKGRCKLAKKYNLFGVMATTWNKVYDEIKDLVYSNCVMWEKDSEYADACTFEILKGFAAQNIRKLVPSNGNYDDAGFMIGQLHSNSN